MSVGPLFLNPIRPIDTGAAPKPTEKVENLGETFGKALQEATNAEKQSNETAEKFAAGDGSVGIHEVVITAEKANIAIRYATTLKNKALEAYRELMNTQV